MTVEILEPGLLQQELTEEGKNKLLRPFNVSIDGETFSVPAGFVHDGSSWPRCLPGPKQSRILAAGCIHDAAFRMGTFGKGGRKIGFIEANRLWYRVARHGDHHDAKANWFWAWCGRAGLFAASYHIWRRYRKMDGEETS